MNLLLAFLLSSSAFATNIGFNQAWFKNNYGTQYLNSHFDETEVERIFKLQSEAHAKEIRLWFFEGAIHLMIEDINTKSMRLKPEYVANVIRMLALAQKYQIKVYMTIFDAHNYRPDKLDHKTLQNFRSLFQETGSQRFLETIIHPLFTAIHEHGLSQVISRVDLLNEGDTVVNRGGFDQGWFGVKRMICQWRDHIHQIAGFEKLPISFSLRLHPLVFLPKSVLDDNGPLMCADYLDFHSYSNDGKIKDCQTLKAYSNLQKKALTLGEFGQSFFNIKYSDRLQSKVTEAYINNLKTCGFSSALVWRLSDVREGFNKEARYSFEAFGSVRPAYKLIQEHNLNHQ